jgi:hypothetical protein
MNRCETCGHWGYDDERSRRFRTCLNDRFIYSADKNEEELEDNGLLFWDYEHYAAYVETGKNFGCIHWEERE